MDSGREEEVKEIPEDTGEEASEAVSDGQTEPEGRTNPEGGTNPEGRTNPARKRWFGRGIYQSKDVPIRLLDGLIAGLLAAILILTIVFAVNGGFRITFDSRGGSEVAYQTLRHGSRVAEPEAPVKPGYEFTGWYQEEAEEPWDFSVNTIGGDLTLYARWEPAAVTVKLDPDGGVWAVSGQEGDNSPKELSVVYGDCYGELPAPVKTGCTFEGWYYSGDLIQAQTQVTMTGEHVLTARWREN